MARPARTSATDLPLYPDEDQIARAVLGPDRARDWCGLAQLLERHGFPRVDPQFGGRYWPAVRAYLDRRHGLRDSVVPSKSDDGANTENWS